MFSWIDAELERLEQAGLRRRLAVRNGPADATMTFDGRPLVNFGSNDYLGLSGDRRLIDAAIACLEREGVGSGASPLITGRTSAHEQLEAALARFEATEAVLLFPSGFAANSGAVAALAGQGDVVFSDAKNHASLWDGCRLSRADVRAYPHGDAAALGKLLASAAKYRRRLVVTDSLFSMDGDLAPLAELADITRRYEAMLLIDEAHATGAFGANGRGVAEHLGVEAEHMVRVGTLSKALGCSGGFVAGSRSLIDWLVQRARPYIYSTAAPPAIAAAAIAALDIVANEPHRRVDLLARAAELRHALADRGWSVGNSASQIIPVIVGTADRALTLASRLRADGFFVPAIRPPTVPDGESCMRISLSWLHTPEAIESLLAAMGSPMTSNNG